MKKLIIFLLVLFLIPSMSMGAEDSAAPKPLHHIIPAKAGGGFDRSSRALTAVWTEILGEPIEFSFEPGMSGGIGFGKLMARPADGFTTIMTTISMHAMNVNTGMVLDGWQNIGFIGNLITDPNVLLVHVDSPYKTINDFIEAGKTAKTPLKISTSHPKAVSTLAARILIELTGINAEVVAFNGGSKSRNALAEKKVDACIGPYFSASSKKDSIRALASFTPKKVYSGLWDIPTLQQATGKEFPNLVEPFAFMIKGATAKQSPERYQQLVKTFQQATQSPKFLEIADKQGMTPFIDYWSPEQCRAYVKDFQNVWNKYKYLMK